MHTIITIRVSPFIYGPDGLYKFYLLIRVIFKTRVSLIKKICKLVSWCRLNKFPILLFFFYFDKNYFLRVY